MNFIYGSVSAAIAAFQCGPIEISLRVGDQAAMRDLSSVAEGEVVQYHCVTGRIDPEEGTGAVPRCGAVDVEKLVYNRCCVGRANRIVDDLLGAGERKSEYRSFVVCASRKCRAVKIVVRAHDNSAQWICAVAS